MKLDVSRRDGKIISTNFIPIVSFRNFNNQTLRLDVSHFLGKDEGQLKSPPITPIWYTPNSQLPERKNKTLPL
jgi:hypothetical protein